MDSSWEIKLAKLLDEHNIKWDRNTVYKFPYIDMNGKNRNYYPDFYLTDYDLFVEVKGYWTTEIRHKIDDSVSRNNLNLLILESLEEISNVKKILSARVV